MLKAIFKHKIFIIIITIMFMLVSSTVDYVLNYNKMTMTLTLNYYGTEKGMYPNGTRFNIFEITSNKVLERAVEKLKLPELTVDKLRGRIDFYARSSGGTVQRVKNAIENGEDYSYIANEYTISYSQKDKIGENHTQDVLKALSEAYREYFNENYTEKSKVLEDEDLDLTQYEYVEIAQIYSNKINSMINYLKTHSDENKTFRSEKTDQTFQDIIVMLQNLNNIEVEKYKAFVIASGITRDKAEFISKLSYKKDAFNMDFARTLNKKNAYIGAIDEYDPSVTDIVYIPSRDENNEFYMNRTKTGLDYLIKSGYDFGIACEQILRDADNNYYWLTMFQNTDAKTNLNNGTTATAESMLDEIEKKLGKIREQAQATDNDYISYKTKDYLRFTVPEYSVADLINVRNVIVYGVIGIACSIILILLREACMKRRKRT